METDTMPIQIIFTSNSALEAMTTMADFIGMRGLADLPPLTSEENRQVVQQGNGAVEAAEAEPTTPKRSRGRPPKAKEEQPAEQAAPADAETQAEAADEAPTGDIEKDRDRVRDALNKYYVDVYGMDATIPDVLAMYKMRFTDGSVAKVSDIPPGMHDTVIQDIKDMSKTNHFKRKRIDL
jgi:hypothetical protein